MDLHGTGITSNGPSSADAGDAASAAGRVAANLLGRRAAALDVTSREMATARTPEEAIASLDRLASLADDGRTAAALKGADAALDGLLAKLDRMLSSPLMLEAALDAARRRAAAREKARWWMQA